MALMPKRVKYRKEFRRVRVPEGHQGNYVAYGDYGLQSLEGDWVPGRVLEAGRIAAQHLLKRQARSTCLPGQAHLQEAAGNPNGYR